MHIGMGRQISVELAVGAISAAALLVGAASFAVGACWGRKLEATRVRQREADDAREDRQRETEAELRGYEDALIEQNMAEANRRRRELQGQRRTPHPGRPTGHPTAKDLSTVPG